MDGRRRKLCCHCNQSVSKSNFYLKHRDGKCLKKVVTVKLLSSKEESCHAAAAEMPSNDQTDLQNNSEAVHSQGEKGKIDLIFLDFINSPRHYTKREVLSRSGSCE